MPLVDVFLQRLHRRKSRRTEAALVLGLGVEELPVAAPVVLVQEDLALGAEHPREVLLVVQVAEQHVPEAAVALRAAIGRLAAVYARGAVWH